MTKIESEKVEIKRSPKEIFDFLADFNNFGKLMPTQVTEYVCTSDECSFNISGMAHLSMKYAQKEPFSKITIVPNGKVPFDFNLNCLIEQSGNGSIAQLVMNADLNMFLKMMAEKPLTNFLNMLVNKLKEI